MSTTTSELRILEMSLDSSAGASSPAMQTNVASIDWLGGKQASRVDSSS